ncbi:hypothetical protein E2C01_003980 [Portunus trituberculatus]|uniref:Uncharacterized protein n=1 Tax=Portunus trituberculatus TaxID=210409 RepID=A0A5B7CSL0_PORTR|nr:hypothetical protein [Portunus trituberculatus]
MDFIHYKFKGNFFLYNDITTQEIKITTAYMANGFSHNSLGTASALLGEYQARRRFRDWYSSAHGPSSGIVFSGESVEHG